MNSANRQAPRSPATLPSGMSGGTGVAGRPVLRRLTSLRAFAALMVFAFHVQATGMVKPHGTAWLGYTGVAFFFVLSGFVLTWSTPEALSRRVFWRNRFARIYPATLVSILAVPIVAVTASSWVVTSKRSLLPAILFVQAWIPNRSIALGWNPVTWSLSCEAAFYLAFPLVLPFLMRSTRRTRVALCLGWFLVASAVVGFVSLHWTGSAPAQAFTDYDPAIRFGEFLLGVLVALEMRAGWRMKTGTALCLAGLSVVLLNITEAGTFPNAELTPLYVAVIAMAARFDLAGSRGLLGSSALVYAGEVSFCFYLVHYLVLGPVRSQVGGGLSGAATGLVAAVVAAMALHHAVELPFQRLIRGRLSAQQSIATHAATLSPANTGGSETPRQADPAVANP